MSLFTAKNYDNLILSNIRSTHPIVASSYVGTVGVPVLFAKQFFRILPRSLQIRAADVSIK